MHKPLTLIGLLSLLLCLAASAGADGYLEPLAEPAADQQPAPCFDVCQSSCCSACECCCDGLDSRRLGGLFLQSDHCFDDFISPISNPFFFEDPRQLTELRGVFIENSLPGSIGNGDLQVYAGQLRGRLSENLSVIAPRLSYFQVNQSGGGNPVGFLSAPVGVKVTLLRDVDRQFLLSAGITYFIPGNLTQLPPLGDGDFHFFLTGGKRIFDYGHWLSGAGFRIPTDSNFGTQMFYWSNQWDYQLPNNIYPLFGINWFHWMRDSGQGFTGPIAGLDLLNLPAANVAGTNVVTSVVGAKWKPSGQCEIGSGFEFPLTTNNDILRNRLYVDVIFRY